MDRFQNMLLGCASVFTALCIGYAMQSSPVAEMRYGPQATRASDMVQQELFVPDAPGPFSGITDLELTSITYTSAPSTFGMSEHAFPDSPRETPELRVHVDNGMDRVSEKLIEASVPAGITHHDTAPPGCVATLTARPLAAAMVDLSLHAPCAPDTRVTLHHNGMMISEQTDAEGSLSLTLPALSETAIFMAAFQNGLTAMAKVEMTSIEIYDRVVVQWQGPGQMQVHALEFGADYGDTGHVWFEAPRDMARAALGKGGFVTVHGRQMPDQDLRAQVYTFPSGTADLSGDIGLTVETEITAETCDRKMEAQALQMLGGRNLTVTDLTLYMPGCDAAGDFLVLKNLLQDLKVARN